MFYEEHTQHGNAHRNLTVFSAFPLSALVSHLCLRSYNWALLLLSLPVVPDSSLFRHRFAVSGRSKQERHNFPWISSSLFVLLLRIYLLLLFTSLALSLQLCFFFLISICSLVLLRWKMSPQFWGEILLLLIWLAVASASPGNLCLWLQAHPFAEVPTSPYCPKHAQESECLWKQDLEQSPMWLLFPMVRISEGNISVLLLSSSILVSSNFLTLFRHLG